MLIMLLSEIHNPSNFTFHVFFPCSSDLSYISWTSYTLISRVPYTKKTVYNFSLNFHGHGRQAVAFIASSIIEYRDLGENKAQQLLAQTTDS